MKPRPSPHSSPTSGATHPNTLHDESPHAPPLNPASGHALLAQRLAEAAAALASAIHALAGSPGAPAPASFSSHPLPTSDTHTITEASNEFLIAKARIGRSAQYLRHLRNSFALFCAGGRGRRALSSITPEELDTFLSTRKASLRTRRGIVEDVLCLYRWAHKRGIIERNPVAGVELPARPPTAPAIQTPAEVKAILDAARAEGASFVRWLAIRYFAGIRTAELARMDEGHILADRGWIEVPAEKAKTRRRRLIAIRPNLAAWLALGGELPLRDLNTRLWRFCQAHPIPKNSPRHCFCSYHLAAFQSASKTALEAGHSEAMLFSVYREVVDTTAAAEYWRIVPDPAS